MGQNALPFWQIMLITSNFWLAVFAVVLWKRGSASTPRPKPRTSPPETPDSASPSLAHLAKLEADQTSLFSTLEKLNTTVKRLSSRAGMRDLREERSSAEAPPVGAPKAELLRHYGMSGKVGPDFARAQQQLELDRTH